MKFQNNRLVLIREKLGINKAEAARMLNMSAMGYGRYERGEREPSFQTVSYIADVFGTTADYLYGNSDESSSKIISISEDENPELYKLVLEYKNDSAFAKRILAYANKIIK